MYRAELEKLGIISQAVGGLTDIVQGGGGNTSVKLDERLMAVKASGFKLSQVNADNGYVVVDYSKLREYYENVKTVPGVDYEKESAEFVKGCIVTLGDSKPLRPSVEAGFHSLMKKYVIHTHPVYANILCCTKKGRELAETIFGKSEYGFVWIPYINPGFSLTVIIRNAIEEFKSTKGFTPGVFFLENHGLIVTSDDCGECTRLHSEVNEKIRQYLGIENPYPEIKLVEAGNDVYESKTGYLNEYFKGSSITADFFTRVALYPDQLVYLGGGICINGSDGKLNIDTGNGCIIYRTGHAEALTMEETLLAFIYVVNESGKKGFEIKTMSREASDFINNWESEKYRKSLVTK